ncbi:MAG: acyl carrier protein [Patescibacteria group bacterium]
MNKLLNILSRVLDIKIEDINDNIGPDNTEGWDSFNGLLLATELEKEFKVKFTMEDIVSIKNVGDIKTILKKRGLKI